PEFPAVGGAAGDVPGAVAAAADRVRLDLVVDAEQRARDRQRGPAGGRDRPDQLADLAGHLAAGGHDRQHLARHPVQPGHSVRGTAEHPGHPVRCRGAGRRERLAAVLEHHVPAAAPGLGDHAAARADLHAQGRRHHLDHDEGRARGRLDDAGHLVLPRGVRHRAARLLPRGGGRQPAHPHRLRRRAAVRAAAEGDAMRAWKTAVGVVLVMVMLFPVYWMVNVSLTKTSDMRADPPHWFPWDPTFEGYAAAFTQQLPALATSLFIGLGTVVLTLAVSLPAGYALAKLRPRGGRAIGFLLLVEVMIPAVVMAMGFYA